jgi:hypothetical protein
VNEWFRKPKAGGEVNGLREIGTFSLGFKMLSGPARPLRRIHVNVRNNGTMRQHLRHVPALGNRGE